MKRATAGLGLLGILVVASLGVGGCLRTDVVVYHAESPPNPNFVFGSQSPVMPPPQWYAERNYAEYASTLDASFFPGELYYYREYTRDYRRSSGDDRYDRHFYSIREGVVHR